MSQWVDALAIMGAFTGVGAAVDFFIGKAGQDKVRQKLETWWLQLSYVNWRGLAAAEANFAIQIMDISIGPSIFSRRRVKLCIVLAIVVEVYNFLFNIYMRSGEDSLGPGFWAALGLLGNRRGIDEYLFSLEYEKLGLPYLIMKLISNFFSINAALTITMGISVIVSRTRSSILNVFFLVFAPIIQLMIFFIWRPIVDVFREAILGDLFVYNAVFYIGDIPTMLERHIFFLTPENGPYYRLWTGNTISDLVIAALRLSLTMAFLLTYLARTAHKPILILWLRVVESEKPSITLICTGIGGLTSLVKTIIENW